VSAEYLDWGEDDDEHGGRVIDLALPPLHPDADPRRVIEPAGPWDPERRHLTADWAWQHLPADVDLFRVEVPPVSPAPAGHSPCPFDRPGRLLIRAHPTSISLPDAARSGLGVLILDGLASLRPTGGTVRVEVRSDAVGARRFYRLTAEWEDTRYYTPSECDELRRMMAQLRDLTAERDEELVKGILALSRLGSGAPPLPDPEPLAIGEAGRIRLLQTGGEPGIDLILTSQPGRPIVGRLLDPHGVLLGESRPLGAAERRRARAPNGLFPHSRLTVGGLSGRGGYLLQVVPAHGEEVLTPVGVHRAPSDLTPDPARP